MCSKVPKILENKFNGYMFKTNFSSIEHWYKKLGDGLTKIDNIKFTCPMFDNKLLASSKQLKLGPRYFIFPIKQENICNYNLRCFVSSGFFLDNIIMNLLSDITEQTKDSRKNDLFSKIQYDKIYFYKGSLQDYYRKNNCWYQKDITCTSFH